MRTRLGLLLSLFFRGLDTEDLREPLGVAFSGEFAFSAEVAFSGEFAFSALYSELAAKQVRARLGGGGGKVQYDYDSDEDTEGGEEGGVGGDSLC